MKGVIASFTHLGFQARPLNWQRRVKARDAASERQPERVVGRFLGRCVNLDAMGWLGRRARWQASSYKGCQSRREIRGRRSSGRWWTGLLALNEISVYVKKSSDFSHFCEWLSAVCIIIPAKFH